MQEKKDRVDKTSQKLKSILGHAEKHKDYELMLETIEAYAFLHCSWNQQYADLEVENALVNISHAFKVPAFSKDELRPKTVIFHDGFAVDMWAGLAYIYVNALLKLGYRIIHLSNKDSEHRQPQFKKAMQGKNIVFEYYCMNGADRMTQAGDIMRIINKYKPEMVFLYISPWDTASILAYSRYSDIVKRYLINATDHTFWIGHSAFDICIEFRNYGASVSMNYRGLNKERLAILPYYPVIDYDTEFEGFPFETDGYKIVFSGGAPYKTIDANNTFFKLVESMLDKHSDVIFVYAPKSDELNCKAVQNKYPERFFLLDKRKDLYQVLKHVDLYIGTYPMGGGLMMQYAAIAGRYMAVVAESDDIRGVLPEEVENKIFYNSVQEMEKDLNRLLDEPDYLKQKEKLVKNAVISEQEFINELGILLQCGKTKYEIEDKKYSVDRLESIFMERFNYKYIFDKCMFRDEVRPKLLKYFPRYFILKEINVGKKLLRKTMQCRKKQCV